MAQVEIRNVDKQFGDHTAISDISLKVNDGELLVLLGPSGCGKSTLLRMIAGLELPTRGEIYIGERRATRLQPKDRNIAMVFQNYALYPHLTAYENIAFPLRVRHAPAGTVDKKVRWAAELVGLGGMLKRKPRQMSGGERQRIALARSLVRDPEVFLFDEPLSNLDAKLRNASREELRQFQARLGVTSIYVTHDQVEAMGLGDRIAVMDAGVIRQIDTPEGIYLNPADVFIASFMGSPPMNLVTTDEHILGFRPEDLLPEGNFAANVEISRFTLNVGRVEYLGGDRLLYARLGGDLPDTQVIARLPSSVAWTGAVGTSATFAVLTANLRYFARDTGTAIAAPKALRRPAHA
jgi:multiple sugar transport system ATP-binding protein